MLDLLFVGYLDFLVGRGSTADNFENATIGSYVAVEGSSAPESGRQAMRVSPDVRDLPSRAQACAPRERFRA